MLFWVSFDSWCINPKVCAGPLETFGFVSFRKKIAFERSLSYMHFFGAHVSRVVLLFFKSHMYVIYPYVIRRIAGGSVVSFKQGYCVVLYFVLVEGVG